MSSIVFVPQCGESSGARGPLAPHLDGFDSWLADQGYAASTRQAKLRLVRTFNGWLEERQLDLPDAALVDSWFGEPGERPQGAPATGRQLLVWLRAIHCLTPEEAGQKSRVSLAAQIESRYERFLRDDRGLSPVTIKDRLRVVHAFLGDRFPTHALDLGALTLDDVKEFICRSCEKVSPGRAKVVVCALRCFLRYLYQRGDIATDIAGAIPGVPNWRLSGLPKALAPNEVEALLESCDRGSAVGRRDLAILLLLARLGLRACEVVRLTLDDVDWTRGVATVSGKGNHRDLMPLPCEVGQAVAAYLLDGRPAACATRRLFVGKMAPHRGFASSTAVGSIVRRAMAQAGIKRSTRGAAHSLRHSLATGMLRNGASLGDIGQLLRHNHPDSTRLYCKVDIESLRSLAPAWPGGTS